MFRLTISSTKELHACFPKKQIKFVKNYFMKLNKKSLRNRGVHRFFFQLYKKKVLLLKSFAIIAMENLHLCGEKT